MSYMSIWSPSDAEKQNILSQHNTPYDGYATIAGNPSNITPLTVQDFAKDKQGMTVGNNGKVQGFSNLGINLVPLGRWEQYMIYSWDFC